MKEYKIANSVWELAHIYKNEANLQYAADIPKIEVDHLVSKLAFAYEKLRYAVDYREEHLVRRHAIERIIKRNYLWKKDLTVSARSLIEELIRAGYLENNAIPEFRVNDLAEVLEKYVLLIHHYPNNKKKRQITNWLLTLSSVEIEYSLISHTPQLKLLENYYNYLKDRLTFRHLPLAEREKNIQIFISAHKALLKSDIPTISYHLFLLYVTNWSEGKNNNPKALANEIDKVKSMIENDLRGPLVDQLNRTIKNSAVYFSTINDLFSRDAKKIDDLLFNVTKLNTEIERICKNKYKDARRKLRRSTINSIIYIFLTKIILAFIIEIPYDFFTLGHINVFPLLANVVFHPLLIFSITTSTRIPSDKNTQKIISEVKNIIYSLSPDKLLHQFKKSAQIGSSKFLITNAIYTVLYMITFGLILWFLSRFGFNLASGLLFAFFLTVISFFGIRIRNSARELLVLKKRENVITFLFDILTLPLLRVGRWISINSSKVNVFIFLFDYVIESPFKVLVKSIETGIFYIKEKKEEIYN